MARKVTASEYGAIRAGVAIGQAEQIARQQLAALEGQPDIVARIAFPLIAGAIANAHMMVGAIQQSPLPKREKRLAWIAYRRLTRR